MCFLSFLSRKDKSETLHIRSFRRRAIQQPVKGFYVFPVLSFSRNRTPVLLYLISTKLVLEKNQSAASYVFSVGAFS
jgi:hypothetical protein